VLICTLADYGIEATVRPGRTGVWVGDGRGERKLAAIGVRVTARGVTLHGFALNVCNALDWYEGIVACGIQGHGVSSMVAETGASLTVEEVSARLARHFGAVFNFEMQECEGVLP
ncbi:MAG: hypothetical protein OXB89_07930, partial [Anaerolineaceae bacterium]|nr:hypothetical protein [Anaerolineaceae bacterium]